VKALLRIRGKPSSWQEKLLNGEALRARQFSAYFTSTAWVFPKTWQKA
jgi:hypothetical protein